MKNIITGWATTIIGFLLMLAGIADYLHIFVIPAPDGVSEMAQVTTTFIVGLALFLVPSSFLEKRLKKIISKKADV